MIKYLQLPTCKLAEFADASATSFTVSGFIYNDGATPVATTDIGDICYATLEPKTAREELISFTIDSVTAEGVATITAVRGLLQKSPYGVGGAAFDHQNGSDLVISNNPGLFNQLTAKDNPEVITEQWSFPEPTTNTSPVTKAYADGLVIMGGAEATDNTRGNVMLSESPAVAIGTCTISVATPAVISFVAHGLVAGDSIKLTTTGALPTGLTAATTYFVIATGLTANTFQVSETLSGSAINTTGTQSGIHTLTRWTPVALKSTSNLVGALSGGGDVGTPSASNKFITENYFSSRTIKRQYDLADSPATWTKQSGLRYIIVEAWGGGGNGSSNNSIPRSGGGGGGGYTQKRIEATDLGATETVTIGGSATNSTFGSLVTGYRGGNGGIYGGGSNVSGGGGGGVTSAGGNGTDGNVGVPGSPGEGIAGTSYNSISSFTFPNNHIHGTYGGGAGASYVHNGGNSLYGGGGGGNHNVGAGASAYGGAGGAGNSSGAGSAGSVPGGGGGGGFTGGGAGGAGRIIVTEYYS